MTSNPQTTLDELKAGNAKFVNDTEVCLNTGKQKRDEIAAGQAPKAVVVTCSDSRVPVELVFEQSVGDVFVIRLAGNVIDEAAIASIEFAVSALGVPLIIMMGHENCGAVEAAISGNTPPTPALKALVDLIKPGVTSDDLNTAIEQNVRYQADQILKRSELLRNEFEKGTISIQRAEFHLQSGKVDWLKP